MATTSKNNSKFPLSRIFSVIRLKRKEITSIYFFAIMHGLLQLSIPLGIQAIVNFIQAFSFSTSLWLLIIFVVVGVAISGGFQVTQLKIIERINQQIFSRYGLEYAYHIPKLDLKSIDNYYLPELVNRFFDAVTLQKGLSKLLIDIPAASIQILFGLLLLSFYSSIFVLFGVLLILVLALLLYTTSPKAYAASLEESDYKYRFAGWIEDMARTIKTFKFSKGTLLHMKNSDYLMGGYLKARTRHFNILVIQYWALIVFKLFITAAMLIVGAVLAINNEINIGQFVAAEIVILMIINSVEKFILSLDNVYDVLTSIEKLEKVLDKPIEKDGTINLNNVDRGLGIKAINLNFEFEANIPLLNDLNCDIPPGSKVCLMGSEGSGKSLFLRLLTGSYSSFRGTITINDIPINNYTLDSLRRATGISINDQDIFEGTILENITMGSEDVSLSYLAELATITGFKQYLSTLHEGYESRLETAGKTLNKSKIQKILLMRALIHNPSLLLLEEPWSAMDEEVQQDIKYYLLNKLKNTTIIVATNDQGFANTCDLIIVLDKGKIVAQGKPGEIVINKKSR